MTKAVYQIVGREQLEALVAPVRHDILDQLMAIGPCSVRELALSLGRNQTAIYSHLKKLEDVGLVQAVEASTGAAGGRPAAMYRTASPDLRLTEATRDPRNRDAVTRIIRTAARQVGRDFVAGLSNSARNPDGPSRNHSYFRAIARPSPKRLRRINALLGELKDLLCSEDPEPGELVSVAWFVSPLRTTSKGEES